MKEDSGRIRWHDVWPVVSPWRLPLLGALCILLAGGGLSILPPLILRRLIDGNLSQGKIEGIITLAAGYLGATVAVHITTFLTSYITTVVAQEALKRLRVRLFQHFMELPISYFDQNPAGEAISRCTSDMETIDHLFSSGVISLLTEVIRIVFTLIAMIALSLPLSVAVVLSLPLLMVISRRFQLRMRSAQRSLRKTTGKMNAQLNEFLQRTEAIKSLNWSFRVIQRFRQTLSDTLKAQNKSIGYGAAYDPILKILQALLIALFLIGGSSPTAGFFNVSIGTLVAFILLFDQFFGPLIRIGNEWQVVQGALSGFERVLQVLSLPAGQPSGITGAALAPASGNGEPVSTELMTFGYVDDQPVLRDISFTVPNNTHLAVVGRTGAGKSTLVHLLCGLYKPWNGSINICGADPFGISPETRSSLLGIVPQSGWMFTGSVADNITMWDRSIPESAIKDAATITGADQIVERLADGYETVISDSSRGGGVQLSAGEQQLFALTRALIANPRVLLFDEATAAVDGATEAAFRHGLQEYLHKTGGAVVTVAHRISTAMAADQIIVLEDGEIVEQGSPETLIDNEGRFAAFWQLSLAGWDWRNDQ